MRRTMTVLLIVLLLVPELPARSNNDWEKVKKLKPGTAVQILLWSGDNLRGRIDSVGDAGLHLTMADGSSSQTSRLSELDRISIRRIARIRQPNLPDPKRWMLTGALAGGAIGLTAGTVADLKHGGNYRWFGGGLGGAGMGFLASCMALAAVGIVDVSRGLRRKVVYEDNVNHPPNGERGSATPSP
jgi:hypothetical protein